ncbi:MAG: hypothetical protein ACLUQW_00355 [Collinsella sp.]
MLWDLQDAITAYAQLSGTALPHPVDLKANDAGSVADGIVLAIEDVADDKTLTAIEQALERFGGTGTRVYAAIRAAQQGTEQARETAVRLHKACERHNQLWCGGVAICAGSGIAALRRSPRMGLLRRPFSEAMDKLVEAFVWGVPSNTRRSSVAPQRAASTPTAWCAPRLHCPHRSGTPL